MEKEEFEMKTVVVQKWEESELGWGSRPDGYTIHQSEQHRIDFIKSYWDSMPPSPPNEYSRPYGSSYLIDISVEDYKELVEKGGSIWENGTPPKGVRTDG